jgi:adenosine kinase
MSTSTTIKKESPSKRTKQTQISILGLGNPLLDISVNVPQEFLDKYDLKTNNAILAEEKHLPIYEEIEKQQPSYVAGGATQNSIRVAQWMLQEAGATAFIGAIGKNCRNGQFLKDAATGDGVRTLYHEVEGIPTGTCAVLINEKDRSLVTNLSAANHFGIEHLEEEHVKQAIEEAKIFYSAGFFLTHKHGPATSLKIAQHASKQNKIYCLNLAAPFITQFFTDPLLSLIPYADFIFGNESEARALSDTLGWSKPEDEEVNLLHVAKKLAEMPKENKQRQRTVVITQGSKQTLVHSGGNDHTFPVHKLESHLIVDTNGAGDAFVGGFLSQLAKDLDIEQCVKAGHAASRVIIQHTGCTFGKEPPVV